MAYFVRRRIGLLAGRGGIRTSIHDIKVKLQVS